MAQNQQTHDLTYEENGMRPHTSDPTIVQEDNLSHNNIFQNVALNQPNIDSMSHQNYQNYNDYQTHGGQGMFDAQQEGQGDMHQTPWLGNNVVQTVRNLKIINENSQANGINGQQSIVNDQNYLADASIENIHSTKQGLPPTGKPPLNRLDTNVSQNNDQGTHRSKLKNALAGFFQPPADRKQSGLDTKRIIPFELPKEETFEEKIARLEQKNLGAARERAPSGDVRLRKQGSSSLNRQMASAAVNGHGKGANNLKRHSDIDVTGGQQMRTSANNMGGMSNLNDGQPALSTYTSTTLLQGNKQHQKMNNLFPENSNPLAKQQHPASPPVMMPGVDMTIEHILQENLMNKNGAVDHLDPSAYVELTEQEIEEIRSRPFMNPEHALHGNKPSSNQIIESESTLIDAKKEKIIEIFKASTDVHEVIENGKRNSFLQQAMTSQNFGDENNNNSNQMVQFDHLSLVNMLMMDKHFITLLGDHLKKKPTARKVEQFMAKQLQARFDALALDAQIVSSFNNLNKRMQERVARIQSIELEVV